MSKRPMPHLDDHKPGKRKNPGQSVNQMKTWQVLARDIPIYFKKQPPLDPELFVYVQVAMLWPNQGKASLMDVRLTEAKMKSARFHAFFTGDCTGFFRSVKQTDMLCLYLSDATVHQVEEQCKQNTLNLPFTLSYDKRCRVKYVERGMMGRSVTFPTTEEKLAAQAKEKRRPLARKETPPFVPGGELLESGPAPLNGVTEVPLRPDTAPAEIASLPGDRCPTPQPEGMRRAKPHRKKKRNPQREGEEVTKLQQPSGPPPDDPDPAMDPGDAKATPSNNPGDGPPPPNREIIDLTIKEESHPGTPIPPAQAPESKNEGPAGLKAGWGSFLPLNEISSSTDTRKLYSTIGVVTSARAVTETRTKELSQRVHLSDPSCPSRDNPTENPMGHGITMFAKRYKEWLPSPKQGHILILKGIKQVKNNQFGDHGSVVFGDKLKWAIYDPVIESVTHGDLGDAPRESGADDGRGAVIKPFYEPEPGDLLYCKRLSEWWKAVEGNRAEECDTAAQCGNVTARKMSQRTHRLISETDHESEPSGYFDCTVQVLNGFKNDNSVYSLYVTDFTKNRALANNDKWPKSRNGTVLKIEMWDAAAARGPSLKNKGYYRLENCRMLNQDSYLQAKLVEPKIRELSKEDEKDMADPKFAELLKREVEFEKGNGVPLTLENAPDESFFNCIVELLDRTNDGSDVFLHVTDYTLVPEIFKSVLSQGPKFEHLKGRVVKVRIRGSLAERASNMPMINSYYLLEKLRFWQTGETWACDIKDGHGYIQKLNPANAEHNGMAEVKRRRKELGSSVTGSDTTSRAHSLTTDPREKPLEAGTGITAGRPVEPLPMVSVLPPKQKLPTCFEVKARILDFYPINLDEEGCLLRVCGDCKNLIPKTAESCLGCSSLTHQAPVVFRYTLLFILGAENGEELVATAGSIDNGLTSGINGQDEDDALHQLKTVLKPLVGNLFEIHKHWLRQEETDLQPDTPFANFKLNAWEEERDEKETVVRYAVQDIITL
ncbi:hypothetical protein BDM02DRAFT_810756 [Thelephora ganbajun]|uniref:Uncharacterized protein n=1 Tax=Thelephora ganbajun TaxID=370292 RepID=A0ACB6ZPA2_THEGA|nr:hypothetical protein BDM02DRAFT_810756 [Thelephora ganbajun]